MDARDAEAVRRWFTETVPTLAPEQIADVLDELIERDGERFEVNFPRDYPTDVDVPTLRSSLPAPIPLLALGWIVFLRRIVYRLTIRWR